MSTPITAAEMAGIISRSVNADMLRAVAETPDGSAFEMTAPATGQRFRVTVAEVPGWSDAMDAELTALAAHVNYHPGPDFAPRGNAQ